MKDREQRFFKELREVPPVPRELFGMVQREVVRERRRRWGMAAAAAAVVLIVGGLVFTTPRQESMSHSAGVDSAAIVELENIAAYIQGTAIDSEIGMYAYVEWSDF